MEPLLTIQPPFIWLYMCPSDQSISRWNQIASISLVAVHLIFISCALSSTLMYFLTFVSIDLVRSMFSGLAFIAFVCGIYVIISGLLLRCKIGDMFKNLSSIYKSNENVDSMQYLIRANRKSVWMWAIFKKIMSIQFGIMLAMAILSIVYSLIYDTHHYYRSFQSLLPWNQDTLWGYSAETFIDVIAAFSYVFPNGAFTVLFISICVHHQAFYQMFEDSIDKWNCSNDTQSDEQFIFHLIHFHISVKQWFIVTTEAYTHFIFIQLIFNTIALAVAVFLFDLQLQHIDFAAFMIFGTALGALAALFFTCYFGNLATESFEKMADRVYDLNWTKLPNGLQKYVVVILIDMQKPLRYHGLKIATMDLNTFIRVLQKVVTYYMMFKTITSN